MCLSGPHSFIWGDFSSRSIQAPVASGWKMSSPSTDITPLVRWVQTEGSQWSPVERGLSTRNRTWGSGALLPSELPGTSEPLHFLKQLLLQREDSWAGLLEVQAAGLWSAVAMLLCIQAKLKVGSQDPNKLSSFHMDDRRGNKGVHRWGVHSWSRQSLRSSWQEGF